MIKKNLQNQRGSALLMTVLILAGIITVALNTGSVVLSGTILSGVQERSTLAFYAAESGAERFLYDARVIENLPNFNNNNLYGTTTLSNKTSYNVEYGTSTPNIFGNSTGVYLETKRMIRLDF